MTEETETIQLEFERIKEQMRELERKVREMIEKNLEKPEVLEK